MFDIIHKGGPLMYLILLCSVFSLTVFIERFIHLYRAGIDTEKFLQKVKEIIKINNIRAAINLCEETPGPIAHIFKSGLSKYDRNREEIKQSIEDAGLHEVPRLQRNINMLATIAHITPLLGLLGTVSGMIGAFQMIQQRSASGIVVNPGDLAGGIWEALITTAAGLVVAIPTYVAYNYLVSKVNNLVIEMEESSKELINILISGGRSNEI